MWFSPRSILGSRLNIADAAASVRLCARLDGVILELGLGILVLLSALRKESSFQLQLALLRSCMHRWHPSRIMIHPLPKDFFLAKMTEGCRRQRP